MKIVKIKIPESSRLYPDHNHNNYIDSYGAIVSDKNDTIAIVDVAKAFLKRFQSKFPLRSDLNFVVCRN
jgi:hypothetical protein